MSFRRMLPFLLLNVLVSAVTMLAILYWWENRQPAVANDGEETAVQPTPPLVTSAPTGAAATDTPEPDDGPLIHVVKAGETLGSLSEFYEVTLDDLMAANEISNPNLLSVGQELIIPIGGLATATPFPTETAAADLLPTPIPTDALPVAEEVNVTITAVTGAGSLTEEAVQIANFGSSQIALLDWELYDEDGHLFTFGQVTLFGDGAAIQVHTEAGQNGPADQYWGLETAVWEPGEQVFLRDAEGDVQSTFTVP